MNKLTMVLVFIFVMSAYAGDSLGTKTFLPVESDKNISAFIIQYSTSLCQKKFVLFRSSIDPRIVDFYKGKKIVLLNKKMDFIEYLFLIAISREFVVYKEAIANPKDIMYCVSDIKDYRLPFNVKEAAKEYGILESEIKLLDYYIKGDPNKTVSTPIVYTTKGVFMALPTDMLEEQQKFY